MCDCEKLNIVDKSYCNCRFYIFCDNADDYNEDCMLFHRFCQDVNEDECYYKQLQKITNENNLLKEDILICMSSKIDIKEYAKIEQKLIKIKENADANYNYYEFKDKNAAKDWQTIKEIIENKGI